MRTLQEEFEFIRKTFFPRWDRKKEWRVILVQDVNGTQGECLKSTKTIHILKELRSIEELQALLIHEICHAVGNWGHARKWQDRMLRSARQAADSGLGALADILRRNVQRYKESHRETAEMVYTEIGDYVLDSPECEFDTIIDYMRRVRGVSREEFLKRYRKSRDVYESNRRWCIDSRLMDQTKKVLMGQASLDGVHSISPKPTTPCSSRQDRG